MSATKEINNLYLILKLDNILLCVCKHAAQNSSLNLNSNWNQRRKCRRCAPRDRRAVSANNNAILAGNPIATIYCQLFLPT